MSSRGLHIVAAAKKQRTKLRLVRGQFIADVVTDPQSEPPVHHWVVQSKNSPDIIAMGQEVSFKDAEAAAASFLKELASKGKKA